MVSGSDYVKTSNDDIVRHISIHELECPLMCDPFDVKLFLKDL